MEKVYDSNCPKCHGTGTYTVKVDNGNDYADDVVIHCDCWKNIGLEVLPNDFAKEALDLMKMVTQHITLSSDWTDGPPVALSVQMAAGVCVMLPATGGTTH